MPERAALRVIIRGKVQGVFYRASAVREAEQLGLTGWVRNLPGGRSVEVEVEGETHSLDAFLAYLKKGPPHALVDSVETVWSEPSGSFTGFSIRY
jgi:acylphosphatase